MKIGGMGVRSACAGAMALGWAACGGGAGRAGFNSRGQSNCAACHPLARAANGSLPLFTDFSDDKRGVPRNPAIARCADLQHFDWGLLAAQVRRPAAPYRTNVNTSEAPYNRLPGDAPARATQRSTPSSTK